MKQWTTQGWQPFERERFAARVLGGAVWIDVGSGDAMYPYREARAHPEVACVAIDPVAENMRKVAVKVGRKKARGGLDNLILIAASIETWPDDLLAVADRVTVNFPWGALLRGVARPDDAVLRPLTGLLKPGGAWRVLLNLQVFDDDPLRERLELPALDEAWVDQSLAPRYAAYGWIVDERRVLGDEPPPARTSWGQRLTLGSRRSTLLIRGHRSEDHGRR